MTLDQLANIGEIIGSIAVIVSIIYLARQIRTNTEAERTSTYQAVVSDFGALNNTMASTPELSYMFVQAMEDYHQMSSDEKKHAFLRYFSNASITLKTCIIKIKRVILTKMSGQVGNVSC